MRSRKRQGLAVTFGLVFGLAACSFGDDEPAGPLLEPQTGAAAEDVSAATDDDQTQTPALPQAGGEDEGGAVATGSAAGLEGAALEEHLARRYEAYWDTFDAARQAPSANPSADFPGLSQYAAGELLDVSHQSLIDLAETGEAIREPDAPAIEGIDANSEHRVSIELIDGTLAEIQGCVVNDDVRHLVANGQVVRDTVVTVLSDATLALTDGEWKVIRSRAREITDGVGGCWLEESEFPW